MYDVKNILNDNDKIFMGRFVIDNNDGTISKFWLCEDEKLLRKSTEDFRFEMVKRIKDDYENYVVNHGDVFRDNIRIGNYLIYNK